MSRITLQELPCPSALLPRLDHREADAEFLRCAAAADGTFYAVRAGGEAVFGTLLEIICLFAVSVPATWAAGMIWHLPFLAVFSFLYTDELIRLAFELWYTRSGKWIKPVTEMGREALPGFRAELAARKGRS